MDLKNLISSGEGQTTAFIESLMLKDEAVEALCSMVNADTARGTVVFGIDPDGNVFGVAPKDLDEAKRSLTKIIKRGFEPQLAVEINAKKLDGKQLLVLTAQRAKGVVYHELDGKVWTRQDLKNILLAPAEKEQLKKARDRDLHEGPWICNRCGNWARQLDCVSAPDGRKEKFYDCGCGGKFWPSR